MDDFAVDDPDYTYIGDTHKHDGFCRDCLSTYIASASWSGLTIPCPQHGCPAVLTSDTVTSHASPELLEKLTRIENDGFISAAKDIEYCPVDNCRCIVMNVVPSEYANRWGPDCLAYAPAVCTLSDDATPEVPDDSKDVTREGVYDPLYRSSSKNQPRAAHRFCWSCKDSKTHWPIPCNMKEQWDEKLEEQGVAKKEEVVSQASKVRWSEKRRSGGA
jgi:hypothetical protein